MGPFEALGKINGLDSVLGPMALCCASEVAYAKLLSVAQALAGKLEPELFSPMAQKDELRKIEMTAPKDSLLRVAATFLRIMAHHKEMKFVHVGAWGLGFAAARFEKKAKEMR